MTRIITEVHRKEGKWRRKKNDENKFTPNEEDKLFNRNENRTQTKSKNHGRSVLKTL